ncbi:MAG: MBL fold metallo-hydrolase [Chloroflexaceae bacterium]|nr:MBL fold metallo-hydrolase [Chloroflexaceae bacterium]
MLEIAPGLYQLNGFPPDMVNMYLMGNILVDAGTRHAAGGLLRQLRGQHVVAHVLTHVHPDHQGASKQICQTLGIPLWCGANDADVMRTGQMERQFPDPNTLSIRAMNRFWAGPAYPVTRTLREGDQIAGFTVVETPGHTPGHLAFWRESDRVLIAGDILNNINMANMQEGLHEPPPIFTLDRATNRESIRKIAELQPAMVCFGHGPVLYDGSRLQAFVAGLMATA